MGVNWRTQKIKAHLKRIDNEYRIAVKGMTNAMKKKFSLRVKIREFVKREMSRGVRFFQAKQVANDTVHHRTEELDEERAVHLLYRRKTRGKGKNGGWSHS